MNLEKVTTENIILGMKKSFSNADELLSESKILSDHKKWARAYTLCQFSIEEMAKISLLFDLCLSRFNDEPISYDKINNTFTNHKKKTELSIRTTIASFQLFKTGNDAKWIDNIINIENESLCKIDELNNFKNESIYVTQKEDVFQSPMEIINEGMFNNIYGRAILYKMLFQAIIKLTEIGIDEMKKQFGVIKEKEKP